MEAKLLKMTITVNVCKEKLHNLEEQELSPLDTCTSASITFAATLLIACHMNYLLYKIPYISIPFVVQIALVNIL